MNHYVQIAIMAVIQGAAELLPVSSSAHVILAERLMGLDPSSPEMVFLLVMLHTGTMFAVLVYFWRRWKALVFPPSAGGEWTHLHFIKMVVLATAITGVLGLIELARVKSLGHEVEQLVENLPLSVASLPPAGIYPLAAG